MKVKFDKVKDAIEPFWDRARLIDRNKSAALKLGAYPTYKRLQLERWRTQNGSEGNRWPKLTPGYKKRKEQEFRSSPGAGQYMMVATGRLFGAVVGSNPLTGAIGSEYHRVMFQGSSMIVRVAEEPKGGFDYASHAAKARPFMRFSKDSIEEMKAELKKYIFGVLK